MKYLKTYEASNFTAKEISDAINDILYLINDILIEEYIEEWNYLIEDDFWKLDSSMHGDDVIPDEIGIYTKSISKSKRILDKIKEEKNNIENHIGINISIEGQKNKKNWPELPEPPGYTEFSIVTIKLNWKNLSDRVNDIKKFFSYALNSTTSDTGPM